MSAEAQETHLQDPQTQGRGEEGRTRTEDLCVQRILAQDDCCPRLDQGQ